ncbi:MAG: DNA-binding protein [Propionivibrio sp.]|uniref:DNA-binding protein n=1 Tax=Candidatus Propionivibrio dominans TaxID=2954373 RepID=A0A9D7FEZ5_9RHOO|nr:DNA-binding protein [Candidatus Propionivibrio dominans]MBL0166881.1 DNA-binding protein [Propionivibrio sp.]
MQNATAAAHFPPLAQETRTAIPTENAAYYLSRRPQTLRAWACMENGPLRPIRISGRLAWRVADLRSLLNGEGV